MTGGAPVVSARGVARRFGTQVALAPTSLDLLPGETLALVGPNGAGKSTLLGILAGALDPDEGVVERRPDVHIGWVPQRPAYYSRLSARENLELFARLEHEPEPAAAATRLLEQFDLPPDDRSSSALSVGNRQRLNVAIALLGSPQALLLDEPTAALDPGQRRRLWELVTRLHDEGGAVCFATQNLEEIDAFADRVVVLQSGTVVFAGTHDEYVSTAAADVFA